jgi:hypothetical protein
MTGLEKINFKDKTEVQTSNINQEENFITGANVNELKKKLNKTIDRSNLHSIMIETLDEYLVQLFNLSMFSTDYLSKDEINKLINDLDLRVEKVEDDMNGSSFHAKLESYKNYVNGVISGVQKNIYDLKSSNRDINITLTNIPQQIESIDNDLKVINSNLLALTAFDNSLYSEIENIKVKNAIQDSDIKSNKSDFSSIKTLVKNNISRIEKLEKVKDNSSILNELYLDNTNILYYLDQCQEKLFLQDTRLDFLERLFRHMETPAKFEDWHRLFSLLNLIKLKISKLSIQRHTQMKDTIFTNEEKKSISQILYEISLKISKFTSEELEDVDLDKEALQNVINNISSLQSLDPGTFEFYPNFPELPENNETNSTESE